MFYATAWAKKRRKPNEELPLTIHAKQRSTPNAELSKGTGRRRKANGTEEYPTAPAKKRTDATQAYPTEPAKEGAKPNPELYPLAAAQTTNNPNPGLSLYPHNLSKRYFRRFMLCTSCFSLCRNRGARCRGCGWGRVWWHCGTHTQSGHGYDGRYQVKGDRVLCRLMSNPRIPIQTRTIHASTLGTGLLCKHFG